MVYTMVYIMVYMGYIMPARSYHGTRAGATPQKNALFCEKNSKIVEILGDSLGTRCFLMPF